MHLRAPLVSLTTAAAWLWICVASTSLIAAPNDPAPPRQESIQGSADSPFVPKGYEKVFADEMTDPSLDTSKWWTRYIYENGKLDTLNDERQLFREDRNHIMTGNTLELTAYHQPDLKPPRFLYRSGMIRSKMTFKYGYFEARLKMPKGLGVWPCFWLNSDADANGTIKWPPEIDICEFVNNGKDDRVNMMHVATIAKNSKTQNGKEIWDNTLLHAHPKLKTTGTGGHYHAPFSFPDDFHVFSALWDTDDTVALFIDGELIMKRKYKWVYPDKTAAGYAHVLLNLSIGGKWAGRYGIDDTAFPQAFEIDYVRVYQKPDSKLTGRSTIGHDLLVRPK